MVEIRIVQHDPGKKPEIQYRYHMLTIDVSGSLCPPNENDIWSEWRTAEWIKAEDVETKSVIIK